MRWFALITALVIAIGSTVWLAVRAVWINDGTTLVLRISGSVSEAEPPRIPILEPVSGWTTYRLYDTLRRAAADKRIAAMLLMPEGVDAGWAKLADIHRGLMAFRKTGKPLVAYLRSPGSREYYLATAADRIAGPPGDYLNLKGFRAELTYARAALDKLGILPEFESLGRYKDGADILTRTTSRPETREEINGLVQARFDDWASTVAASRKRTPEQIKALIDDGPFLSKAAKDAGLTDAVEFEEQTRSELAKRLGQKELTTVSAVDYRRSGDRGRHRIAFLAAEGDIARDKRLEAVTTLLLPDAFAAVVKQLREDDRIKAVILRIDSPGGDAVASEEMTHQVRLLAEKKPVIVSMSDVAASAGYQIAVPGHVICADPRTVTGSIGVFFGKVSLGGLYGKLGISKELITRGKHATIDSDVQPLSEPERIKLRSSLEQFYKDFVTQVAQGRKRPYEEIDNVAQGRVWLGDAARRNGLVDELGGIAEAIALARQKASIPEGDAIRIEIYPRQPGFVDSIRRRLSLLQAALPATGTQSSIWKRLPFLIDIH